MRHAPHFASTLDESRRPVDLAAVEEHKQRMIEEVSANILREQKHQRGGDGMAFSKRWL